MHFRKHLGESKGQVPTSPGFKGQEGAWVPASIYLTCRSSGQSASWHTAEPPSPLSQDEIFSLLASPPAWTLPQELETRRCWEDHLEAPRQEGAALHTRRLSSIHQVRLLHSRRGPRLQCLLLLSAHFLLRFGNFQA